MYIVILCIACVLDTSCVTPLCSLVEQCLDDPGAAVGDLAASKRRKVSEKGNLGNRITDYGGYIMVV